MYRKVKNPMTGLDDKFLQRVEDGLYIPCDENNTDYQKYLAWCAEGNEPEPSES